MTDKNDDIQQRNIDLLIAGYWYENLPPVIDIATKMVRMWLGKRSSTETQIGSDNEVTRNVTSSVTLTTKEIFKLFPNLGNDMRRKMYR